MAHVVGLLLIDAPASALNNAKTGSGSATNNTVEVKQIRSKSGIYPYVSAQAFRYWLRSTLEKEPDLQWHPTPVFRGDKTAYTDGNPLRYDDDDLLGYMRAVKAKKGAAAKKSANESTKEATITRISPFRVSTLVSIAPTTPVNDFGVASRHDGDPVLYEHQFYRTTLQGLFSLDLHAAGTFWDRSRSGYQNLDEHRRADAQAQGLTPIQLDGGTAYRLPTSERIRRISTLLTGIGRLSGGAKLTQHYTDVTPSLLLMAVSRGGNHLFQHCITADSKGLPVLQTEALLETLQVFGDQFLSPLYLGWPRGYLEEQRARVLPQLQALTGDLPLISGHPRQVLERLAADLAAHPDWLQ